MPAARFSPKSCPYVFESAVLSELRFYQAVRLYGSETERLPQGVAEFNAWESSAVVTQNIDGSNSSSCVLSRGWIDSAATGWTTFADERLHMRRRIARSAAASQLDVSRELDADA